MERKERRERNWLGVAKTCSSDGSPARVRVRRTEQQQSVITCLRVLSLGFSDTCSVVLT